MAGLEHVLTHLIPEVVKGLDENIVDSFVVENEIQNIIKNNAKLAAGSGLASGWVPGLGGAALATVTAGFVWKMYIEINRELNIPFSENLIKSIGTGVATNLASYTVASILISSIFSFFPGLGSVASSVIVGGTSYGLTLAAGVVYLKVLKNLFVDHGLDISQIDESVLKNSIDNTIEADEDEIKDIIKKSIKDYKEGNKEDYKNTPNNYNQELFNKVQYVISEQLNISKYQIKLHSNWKELGADSLDLVELVMAIEEKFNIEIEDSVAESFRTVEDLIMYLQYKKY